MVVPQRYFHPTSFINYERYRAFRQQLDPWNTRYQPNEYEYNYQRGLNSIIDNGADSYPADLPGPFTYNPQPYTPSSLSEAISPAEDSDFVLSDISEFVSDSPAVVESIGAADIVAPEIALPLTAGLLVAQYDPRSYFEIAAQTLTSNQYGFLKAGQQVYEEIKSHYSPSPSQAGGPKANPDKTANGGSLSINHGNTR